VSSMRYKPQTLYNVMDFRIYLLVLTVKAVSVATVKRLPKEMTVVHMSNLVTVYIDEDLLFGTEETIPEQTVCYSGNCGLLDELSMDTVDDNFLPWIHEETIVTDRSVASL